MTGFGRGVRGQKAVPRCFSVAENGRRSGDIKWRRRGWQLAVFGWRRFEEAI